MKENLKKKMSAIKQWCKDHKETVFTIVTTSVIGGFVGGHMYKKGWDAAFDKWEKHVDEHCAFLQPTETITPRDIMRDDAITKTIERGEASDRLDKPIKEIQFWF